MKFDDHVGLVDFAPVASGTCRLDATQEGVLLLDLTATDQAALERLQRVLTEHVERFAQHERLTVEWRPAADRPATG